MRKKQLILALSATLIAFIYFGISKKPELRQIYINNTALKVEVAETPKSHMKGLMFRKSLPQDQGMLFIFEDSRKHSFWMKNTKIPLDMLWINSDSKIVHIQHSAPPCQENPCVLYSSTEPANYVLELNGGWAIEHSVTVGDSVDLSSL